MYRASRSVTLGVWFLIPAALGAQALPKLPTVARGACPFECCQLGHWTALDTLRVYSRERSATRPVAVLRPGQSFTADSADFGEMVWLRGVEATVNWFWADSKEDLAELNAPALLVRPLRQEWWVRIHTSGGRGGWIQAWNKSIEGKDSCG